MTVSDLTDEAFVARVLTAAQRAALALHGYVLMRIAFAAGDDRIRVVRPGEQGPVAMRFEDGEWMFYTRYMRQRGWVEDHNTYDTDRAVHLLLGGE